MAKKKYRPWLRAFSGLSSNISAAWFATGFIGPNVSFPTSLFSSLVLIFDITFGIVFLLINVWCERKLQK